MLIRILIVYLFLPLKAFASAQSHWELASDLGAYGLVTAAFVIPVIQRDTEGLHQATYSIAAASGIGLLGKALIDAERPDNSNNRSFPSNHTANAFAAATTLHIRYGWKYGLPAFGIASIVGVGRVEADKHFWRDVIAGAAIGAGSAWFFTDKFEENVQLIPNLSHDSFGLTLRYTW